MDRKKILNTAVLSAKTVIDNVACFSDSDFEDLKELSVMPAVTELTKRLLCAAYDECC